MANPIQRAHAAGHASIDELAEEQQEALRERYGQLISNTEGRIPALWQRAEADAAKTHVQFSAVPIGERDMEWSNGFAAMIAAAQWQAWLEVMGVEVLRKTDKYSKRLFEISGSMSREEIIETAAEGFHKEDFESAKTKRKAARTVSI